jgi:hypothetical protein
MTAIRMSFVMGMENKGSMQVPREPIILCIVRICESHLLLYHVRQQSMARILAFTLYSVWASTTWLDHWLIRYPTCAVLCWFAWTKRPAIQQYRDNLRSWLLTPFEGGALDLSHAVGVVYNDEWLSSRSESRANGSISRSMSMCNIKYVFS